ncbi:ubiquitin-conjugating enzyme E2 U [Spea bombifrons]|uniref:ubiquitin-conjugating enzyme E2 U n=1 Tax=Spea bombifrons TaxID=233779 RepID=UPI002349EDBE|nr:ubiquitin-conjugating enzyme E2 U [Spea bombifrons]
MHSRSYLLLEKEYEELKEGRIYGISAAPRTDNLLEWIAEVHGLKDSLWEGAFLQLSLKYTETYNHVPPAVRFNTIPFHPNVDPSTGRPCVDFLDNPEEWNPRYTMSSVLLAIQVLLSNPQAENALNLDAADLLANKPSAYRGLVLDCVKNSRRLEDGVIPDYPKITTPPPPAPPAQRKIRPVSFEEYHRNWAEIATSKAPGDLKKNKEASSGALFSDAKDEINRNKIYKSFISRVGNNSTHSKGIPAERDPPGCPMCRLSEICGVPLIAHSSRKHEVGRSSNYQGEETHHERGRHEEPGEEEVDTLVTWANALKTELLEDY